MNNYKLFPSILAADHGKFLEEAKTVDIPQIDTLHIDVMDGHFVPNITFGPRLVTSLKKHTGFLLDVHLMIEKVDFYIPRFIEAGADQLTIHQEATAHLDRSLTLVREGGAKVGVALNPATPLDTLRWVLDKVDQVLIMSVNPGFGGQSFIQSSLEKLRKLQNLREKYRYSFIIGVDGGIDEKTAPVAIDNGADYLVSGSAIFDQKDRQSAIQAIRRAIERDRRKKNLIYT